MGAATELGRNLVVSKHQIQPEYVDEQADAGRNWRTRLARPILRRERGQEYIPFPCSADHEQDWQPNPVDRYSCYIYVTITYIYIVPVLELEYSFYFIPTMNMPRISCTTTAQVEVPILE